MNRNERRRDAGFSMIELLVVMIVIAVLAAIAIPVYLNQTRNAHDAAARSDAQNLGTMISATYSKVPVTAVELKSGAYFINGDEAMDASPGVELVTWKPGSIDSWCVQLRHPKGKVAQSPGVRFDANQGYVEGAPC